MWKLGLNRIGFAIRHTRLGPRRKIFRVQNLVVKEVQSKISGVLRGFFVLITDENTQVWEGGFGSGSNGSAKNTVPTGAKYLNLIGGLKKYSIEHVYCQYLSYVTFQYKWDHFVDLVE